MIGQTYTDKLYELSTQDRIDVSLPSGEFSEEQKEKIIRSVFCALYTATSPAERDRALREIIRLPEFYEDIISNRWTVTKGKYAGTLPKRVANYLFKVHGFRLTAEEISEVGNLTKNCLDNESKFVVDFTRSLDWEAGDFGDFGSCYWGCRTGARTMLSDHNAYAIRFYDRDNRARGKGRAWIITGEIDGVIVYNAYGPYQLPTVTHVLAQLLGGSYKKIKLSNLGDTGGTLWINSDCGYAIASPDVLENITSVNLHWDEVKEYTHFCDDCEEGIAEDDDYYHVGDYIVCQNCIDNYSRCEHCDEYYSNSNVHEVHLQTRWGTEGEYWCEDCIRGNTVECEDCEDTWRDNDAIYIEDLDYYVCPDCFERNYSACEDCDCMCHNDDITYMERLYKAVCNDCLENYARCEDCNDWREKDDLINGLCPVCYEPEETPALQEG